MHIGKLNSKEEVQIENLVSFIPFFISCLPQCSYLVSQFPKTEKCYHRTSIFLEFLLTRHPYWNLDSQKPEATLSSTLSSLPRHPSSRRILSRSSHPSAYRTLPGPRVHVLYGAGSGAPLQCSCLENPRDGGAWWAAVYGVAQSQTPLKRLSSSSHLECPYAISPGLIVKNFWSLNLGDASSQKFSMTCQSGLDLTLGPW